MGEHRPPAEPDAEFANWIRERRNAGRVAELAGFGREGVRIVLREDLVHLVYQSGRLNVRCPLPFLNQRRWK
ncbi:hypothetical protein X961_6110 [Burkholderia pseudomallei MSHR5613]|nr:hypothetical protein DO65_5119 [Burkholderia pseudomallei]KGS54726.1 hypothetical protein X961_6110 [Burkholderia pseudomallei MSHR5613]KGX66122.1 hypothetical protein Y027_6072 [Burkholderia pseudomallei TSV5]KGX66393.1 hypothetical protein Y025_6013 [Burkholderia pseudomallei TSV32]